jgi:hypothetical protein
MGEKINKVIRPLNKTMNENPKCHLHIPQLLKNIYMLNIIIQGILEKRRCERKGSKGNTQNPNAPSRGIITKWKQKKIKAT